RGEGSFSFFIHTLIMNYLHHFLNPPTPPKSEEPTKGLFGFWWGEACGLDVREPLNSNKRNVKNRKSGQI
ncbi:hypothetical protein R6G69_07395, partial [Actinotignum urinale]|uniref:hypothetical protein n=1 Tax=Actinotignum urinale TaxID=190146 RepID=UPI002A822224